MPTVVVGYGQYNNYRLAEIPTDLLLQLSARYPLAVSPHTQPDQKTLTITVAVHSELQRRQSGGVQEKRPPAVRDIAVEIIEAGYRDICLKYHPNGAPSSQNDRVNKARSELLRLVRKVAGDVQVGGTLAIPSEGKPRIEPFVSSAVDYDEDIPF